MVFSSKPCLSDASLQSAQSPAGSRRPDCDDTHSCPSKLDDKGHGQRFLLQSQIHIMFCKKSEKSWSSFFVAFCELTD